MITPSSGYGLWFFALINAAIFILFAFSFFKPKTAWDWLSLGDWLQRHRHSDGGGYYFWDWPHHDAGDRCHFHVCQHCHRRHQRSIPALL